MPSKMRIMLVEGDRVSAGPRQVIPRLQRYMDFAAPAPGLPAWRRIRAMWEELGARANTRNGLKLLMWKEPRRCPWKRSRYMQMLWEHGLARPRYYRRHNVLRAADGQHRRVAQPRVVARGQWIPPDQRAQQGVREVLRGMGANLADLDADIPVPEDGL